MSGYASILSCWKDQIPRATRPRPEDERQQPVVKRVREQAGHDGSPLLAHEQHRAVDDHAIAAGQAAGHDDGVVAARTE